MRTTRSTPLITLALLVLLAPAAGAQQPAPSPDQPQGQFGEQLEVGEVLLDVLVTDADGNAVLGLGPDDFVVEEAGQARKVTSVSYYANRLVGGALPTVAAKKASVETLPDDRYFILFFQDQRQRQFDTDVPLLRQQFNAGRFAKKWVQEDLLPDDWVAVVSYDSRLRVQTDFTRDHDTIAKAIDSAIQGKSLDMDEFAQVGNSNGPSLVDDLPRGRYLRKESRRIYGALELVAQATGDIRARKNLVMFGIGFGILTTSDREDIRYYQPMMETLNANNVAAYMVDLSPNTVEHAMSDPMNRLATETGGRYFFNFTNFQTPLSQIADENNGYYLLSYQSSHPRGETGYQKVTVKTVNPDLKVKTREGYVFGDADQLHMDVPQGVSAAK